MPPPGRAARGIRPASSPPNPGTKGGPSLFFYSKILSPKASRGGDPRNAGAVHAYSVSFFARSLIALSSL